jgi:integral membrane sensor domain MASE1
MVETVAKNSKIYKYIIIFVIATVINSLLARFAVVAFPSAPGVSELYFAVAFMIVFTLWFGAWGAIAAYLGCIIGSGLSYVPFSVNLYWSLADLWQVLIPLFAFKAFHADVGLKTKRDFLIYLVFGVLLNCLIGAIWGSTMLAVGGVYEWSEVGKAFTSWFVGDIIVVIVITTLLLKYVTGYIVKSGLYVKNYWF